VSVLVYTTQNGQEEAGNQFLISEMLKPSVGLQIRFDVQVVKHETAETLLRKGHIAIVPGVGDPTFTLTDPG